MADFNVDLQAPAATPAAGSSLLFPHLTTGKRWASKDDTGRVLTMPSLFNANNADVGAPSVDTYLAGSSIAIPSHLMQALTVFRWKLAMSKSAAGVAAPTWNIRVGAAGAVGDASRILFTSPSLQTAVVDNGEVEIHAIVRNAGAAAVMAAFLKMTHLNPATGLASVALVELQVTSAAFDATVANLIVGLSVNPGALGVWTHQLVLAEAFGI